jgi:MFS family permease
VLGVLLIASFVMLVWSIAAGHLSDLYGRHRMLLIGAGGFAIWSFVMWPLINAGSFWMLLIAFVVGLGGFAGILSGVVGAFLMELFPTSVRFSGVSLSVQVASVLAGAFAPLIAAALYGAYASTLPVAVLVAAWCVVTVISVAVLKVIRSTPYEI